MTAQAARDGRPEQDATAGTGPVALRAARRGAPAAIVSQQPVLPFEREATVMRAWFTGQARVRSAG
jgi:hypothetical protein